MYTLSEPPDYNIRNFDFYSISPDRLTRPTVELALLYDALAKALLKRPGLSAIKRGRQWLLFKFESGTHTVFSDLDGVNGVVPGTSLAWSEAASIRLDYHSGRTWLLIKPTVFLAWNGDEDEGQATAPKSSFANDSRFAEIENTTLYWTAGLTLFSVPTQASLSIRLESRTGQTLCSNCQKQQDLAGGIRHDRCGHGL